MFPKGWRLAPQRAAIVLLAGTAVSVIAVLWMGWLFLQQDRTLESQQSKQKLESVADGIAAVLDRVLAQTTMAMTSASWRPPGGGAVVVRMQEGSLTAVPPGVLLFAPSSLRGAPAQDSLFDSAEREEFSRNNLGGAAQQYRELAATANASVRAAALVRLARVQARSGDPKSALDTYYRLARIEQAEFDGVPVSWVAHQASSALLATMNRPDESREAAVNLGHALERVLQPPSREVFLFYASRAEALSGGSWKEGGERLVLSEAVAAAWPAADGDGRAYVPPVTMLWSRAGPNVTLLAAGMDYARREWLAKAEALAAQAGAQLDINGAANSSAVTRSAAATGLPWRISLREAPGGRPGWLVSRRQMLATTILALAVALLLAGLVMHHAVSRGLAVARLQSDFVAAVSHEFRTPLTAMRQFTEMLLERPELSLDQQRTCFKAQARSTERLSRLIESLLDFKRMEEGAKPYRLELLDAAELAGQVACEFGRESGAQVILNLSDRLPVMADASALSLALWNLLDNAVKYSPGRPPVSLGARRDAGRARISVVDSGVGIAPAEQRRIFEKFARGAEARRMGVTGAGIGLAMVKHIVDAHRGRIDVESRVDQGSTFTIVLPLVEEQCVQNSDH
jgi:signal transduction histidine kinase